LRNFSYKIVNPPYVLGSHFYPHREEKSIFQKFTQDFMVYKINYFIFAPGLRAAKSGSRLF
jgi:hypothetical protein